MEFLYNKENILILKKLLSTFFILVILMITGCGHYKHGHVPPGHDPAGPGNSENAPGHNKYKAHWIFSWI